VWSLFCCECAPPLDTVFAHQTMCMLSPTINFFLRVECLLCYDGASLLADAAHVGAQPNRGKWQGHECVCLVLVGATFGKEAAHIQNI
jgi:hypothetical protein